MGGQEVVVDGGAGDRREDAQHLVGLLGRAAGAADRGLVVPDAGRREVAEAHVGEVWGVIHLSRIAARCMRVERAQRVSPRDHHSRPIRRGHAGRLAGPEGAHLRRLRTSASNSFGVALAVRTSGNRLRPSSRQRASQVVRRPRARLVTLTTPLLGRRRGPVLPPAVPHVGLTAAGDRGGVLTVLVGLVERPVELFLGHGAERGDVLQLQRPVQPAVEQQFTSTASRKATYRPM